MRRIAPVAVLAAVLAGVALAAPTKGTVTVKVSTSTALGTKIVVNSSGLTLYHFVPETKGTIKCTGSCSTDWPPLTVAKGVKPVAGPGLVASKLGTIKRPDGRYQVTYNGLALYRYSDDKTAGSLDGQGEGGIWFAVTPAGTVTKTKASSSDATTNQAANTGTANAGGAAGAGAGAAGGGSAGGSDYNY
jgi:predicted lipoprotein with Yx(FWY)xxD motif